MESAFDVVTMSLGTVLVVALISPRQGTVMLNSLIPNMTYITNALQVHSIWYRPSSVDQFNHTTNNHTTNV